MSVEKVATLELLPRCRARIPALGAVPRRGGIAFARAGRDAEALRRIAAIERRFADAMVSLDWRPYAATLQKGVFASRFPADGYVLWTLVNRNEYEVDGEQLAVPHAEGARSFDAWNGTALQPRVSVS